MTKAEIAKALNVPHPKGKSPRGGNAVPVADLHELAVEAGFREQISKANLVEYKVEKEKLGIEKAAGDVMMTAFAESLFFSYLDQVHTDLLLMTKKIRQRIEEAVAAGDSAAIMRLIEQEHSAILTDVKKAQIKALKKWKDSP